MNPIAVVLLLVGAAMIVVGFKGKQDDLISAITGSHYGNTKLA